MNLTDARTASNQIKAALSPDCVRCEVAGSIRRSSDAPGDIDMVVIPKSTRPPLVFGQKHPAHKTDLDATLYRLCAENRLEFTAGGDKLKKYIVPLYKWGVSGFVRDTHVKMQITIATPETWAYWYLIRTGPADFSHWIVSPKDKNGPLPEGWYFDGARLYPGPLDTPDEGDIFAALGLPFVAPTSRRAQWGKTP